MDARRARILVVAIFSVSLLTPLLVASAAAATCTLIAPARVAVGTPLAIAGSGFPASSSVDISLTLEGGLPDGFTVQSDAGGTFQISLTPEGADAGKTTIVATAGAGCTARFVFTVGGSAVAVTPAPTEAPASAAAGTDATPPRSDASLTVPARTTAPPLTAWLVAVLILVIGVGGLIATRPARSR